MDFSVLFLYILLNLPILQVLDIQPVAGATIAKDIISKIRKNIRPEHDLFLCCPILVMEKKYLATVSRSQ
jgi:hypothetical protein